jgi:hypothetical protein
MNWSPKNPESPEDHRTLLRAAPETLFRLPEGSPRSTTSIESAAHAPDASASQPAIIPTFGFFNMHLSPENLFYIRSYDKRSEPSQLVMNSVAQSALRFVGQALSPAKTVGEASCPLMTPS